MGRITEELVRKRSEHNEMEISTLEEISLHQQDIEKIEFLDKWCRKLKILYLQSNLIEKIENVGRLKQLEYLNLALNNVERIENLEGCESLHKLDLTVNFIAELTSIEHVQSLEFLEEMYLTGNPCCDYEGYREFVIASLPRLTKLDGVEVEKSERIKAVQKLSELRTSIIRQQNARMKEMAQEAELERQKEEQKKKPGFDGRWYTDVNNTEPADEEKFKAKQEDAENDEFWNEPVAYTPASRKQVHEHMAKARAKDQKKPDEEEKKSRRLYNDNGRPLNVNEAKIDFNLIDDEEANEFRLDVAAFKHLDTSLMDVDVQTTHVKVVLKGKIFQLVMDEEINPDKSKAQRSSVTGHLVITMPKAKAAITRAKPAPAPKVEKKMKGKMKRELLEVDPNKHTMPDISNIVSKSNKSTVEGPLGTENKKSMRSMKERENSADFIDDPDVPPLC